MATGTHATLRVAGRPRDALSLSALHRLDGAPLVEFLRRQRWFGDKGQSDLDASFVDVIPVFGESADDAIARVEVSAGGATIGRYQMPLAVRPAGGAAGEAGVLAEVESPSGRGVLFDAVRDGDFRTRLVRALQEGETFEGAGARWSAEPHGRLPEPATPSRLLEGEQSNSSIAYGQMAILKIYRRLTAGPNPEAEIAAFLAGRGFPYVPSLLGLFHLVDRDGSKTVAGIVQQFVTSIGDGWSYARRRIHDLVISPHDKNTGRSAFVEDGRRLGEVTAALHRALACDDSHPDFSPQPVRGEDLTRWTDALRRQVEASVALLEAALRGGTIAGERKTAARAILADARALADGAGAFLSALGDDAGARIRHHGDYHLGQVLRKTDGDYVILDFEGEPARPLAERRQRHSPLRDVAGMLRSFDYAAAVTVKEDAAASANVGLLETEAAALATEVQGAFREGYFRMAPRAPILPASASVADRLLTVFEIEKAFYELAYELNNRPQWADIPLRGLLGLQRRLSSGGSRSEAL